MRPPPPLPLRQANQLTVDRRLWDAANTSLPLPLSFPAAHTIPGTGQAQKPSGFWEGGCLDWQLPRLPPAGQGHATWRCSPLSALLSGRHPSFPSIPSHITTPATYLENFLFWGGGGWWCNFPFFKLK